MVSGRLGADAVRSACSCVELATGVAIAATQFDWTFDYESYYLACLFHDLGATPENLAA